MKIEIGSGTFEGNFKPRTTIIAKPGEATGPLIAPEYKYGDAVRITGPNFITFISGPVRVW